MHPPAEQLEVVAEDEERADRDEDEQPGPDGGDPDDAESAREDETPGSGADEPGGRNRGAQRAAVELVEGMGGDADGEEEREHRRDEASGVGVWRERRADDDVRQVPRRVRRVQQGPPVAPAAGARGVERGPCHGQPSGLRAHITSPPPRLIERTPTSTSPAASQARTVHSTG